MIAYLFSMVWKAVRVKDTVHNEINRLGSCGMTKSDVLQALVNFYRKNKHNHELGEFL